MYETQPEKEKGHPQAFCISTTVSDISFIIPQQSGMDVCFQDSAALFFLEITSPFFSFKKKIILASLLCSRLHP